MPANLLIVTLIHLTSTVVFPFPPRSSKHAQNRNECRLLRGLIEDFTSVWYISRFYCLFTSCGFFVCIFRTIRGCKLSVSDPIRCSKRLRKENDKYNLRQNIPRSFFLVQCTMILIDTSLMQWFASQRQNFAGNVSLRLFLLLIGM